MLKWNAALGDLIMRAYLLRRSLLIELGAGFRIIGSRFSPDTRRLREFVARNRLPHRYVDLEEDKAAEALLGQLGVEPGETPVVIWRDRVLRNPTNSELAQLLGLRHPTSASDVRDFIVVGAGPAGLAAAVYGASEGLTTVVFDAVATGGQAATSPRIENYLGFPAGISGAELAERAVIQAEKFGARISVPTEVVALEQSDGHYAVRLDDGTDGRRTRDSDRDGCALSPAGCSSPRGVRGRQRLLRRHAGRGAGVRGRSGSRRRRRQLRRPSALFLTEHAARVHLIVRGDDLEENMSLLGR